MNGQYLALLVIGYSTSLKAKRSLLLLVFSLLSATASYAQDRYGVDSSFGNNGLAVASQVGGLFSLSIQADGKILAGGIFYGRGGILRFNSNGLLDSSFAVNGYFNLNFQPDSFTADGSTTVLAQPDGKILATSKASGPISSSDYMLLRLNSDGTLDTSFAHQGYTVYHQWGADDPHALALQPDGKILVTGQFGYTPATLRYYSDGTLDSSFGNSGLVLSPAGLYGGNAVGVAVMPDGRVVVGGNYYNTDTKDDYQAIRLLSNGQSDTSFNHVGFATANVGDPYDASHAMVLQPDGKIVVAGASWSEMSAVRFDTTGQLDTSFNHTGTFSYYFGGYYGGAYAMVLQPDGKIILGGRADTNGRNFALLRLLPDGRLDHMFGHQGTLITNVSDTMDEMETLALQPDGKIPAGGYSQILDAGVALVRYQPDATLKTDDPPAAFNTITLYPNPVNQGQLQYKNNSPQTITAIEVLAADGRLCRQYRQHLPAALDLNDLSSGTYFIRFFSKDRTPLWTGKFLVIR